jgi:hypothetical protein
VKDFTVMQPGLRWGTVYLVTANTEAARQWLDDNLTGEHTMLDLLTVAVEARFIGHLLSGAREAGLTIERE